MSEGAAVEIKPAKGRPMLTWVGKRPLRHVTAFPAQLVETYAAPDLTGFGKPVRSQAGGEDLWADWPAAYPRGGLLFHGDNNDPFFDGTLGRSLVKIVPFTHPLSVPDLEEVKRELAARPEEERDVTVVCLGKELAADAWLEEWNQLRARTKLPNQIAVIELRTDPRYGRFFIHQPAYAKVTVERREGKIKVRIDEFVSPTIIERLKEQAGVLAPQIGDWRAMVDSVMIDTAYDGQVFNVTLADVPEKKSDLVAGEYQLDAPAGETTVAVKITDMLGEEIIATERV